MNELIAFDQLNSMQKIILASLIAANTSTYPYILNFKIAPTKTFEDYLIRRAFSTRIVKTNHDVPMETGQRYSINMEQKELDKMIMLIVNRKEIVPKNDPALLYLWKATLISECCKYIYYIFEKNNWDIKYRIIFEKNLVDILFDKVHVYSVTELYDIFVHAEILVKNELKNHKNKKAYSIYPSVLNNHIKKIMDMHFKLKPSFALPDLPRNAINLIIFKYCLKINDDYFNLPCSHI